ncbi:transcriptional regulator with XRE-family HTH domain [Dysgonomonas sp. PFB1-18]|uniref:helix-turn-helix domain-containing protein n=1 Tax=unclassified Dysgonomonas TaxID=2630389 RepID=UPI002476DD77|nr:MULTISPECIES: helix-turn-helix domain-containing protein [unclassified Dysgonomonas]MDH6310585.1 transcriptional regulator with XRE-family HTH domain [Dysgonomonas sp. PF1-14]MDH6340435.1 transcriptional regulator with XRE-family HTH domain [Dysgonomonas sp. PF1-16]MDH6381985.1 transcriptional regulator with XRE-family HTH domain [Dysgonomonas sp. PFB1-18]MDH6399406.1 transcriptional regulator with XRE-family HTH domain [Dysgonomonas sp. PF1-23]
MAKQELSISQKKEWAKLLFTKENLTQAEIAERVGVRPATLSKWVNTENWQLLKTSITITREEQLARLYQQLQLLQEKILERPIAERFPTTGEADTITKLASAIEKLERETGLSEIIGVSKQFIDWLRLSDLDKAKELTMYFDAFIKERLR